MEDKIVVLEQDNGNNKLAIRFKRGDIYLLEQDIKRITGWRCSTKKYNSIYHRFLSQGSYRYNDIIEQLHKRGW